jgi:hypothetical protein
MESYQENRAVKIENYLGKVFTTKSNSNYSISQRGEFAGRPSIEGAKVQLMAGIEEDPNLLKYFYRCLDSSDPKLRDKLDELILRHGQEIKPGLCIVASLTPSAAKDKERHGIVTTSVKAIDYIN